jgi:hypothetical protein
MIPNYLIIALVVLIFVVCFTFSLEEENEEKDSAPRGRSRSPKISYTMRSGSGLRAEQSTMNR